MLLAKQSWMVLQGNVMLIALYVAAPWFQNGNGMPINQAGPSPCVEQPYVCQPAQCSSHIGTDSLMVPALFCSLLQLQMHVVLQAGGVSGAAGWLYGEAILSARELVRHSPPLTICASPVSQPS
jgi:hypothetical protein